MEKISVIMGLYNCSETLPKAIESILHQSYTNWELIMCDDGSNDNTFAVASAYAEQYPGKIFVIRHQQNEHLSASLNDCLKKATGYYVARMDADDVSDPMRFETQVSFLKQNPEISLVGTAMQLFDADKKLNVIKQPQYPDKYYLKNRTPFFHPTIMTYKRVLEDLGGYTVSKRTIRGQDYDLWFRFYAKGYTGANLQEPLYYFKSDLGAYKRRTAKARFNTVRTMYIGYKSLHYPWYWYFIPLKELLKILIPSRLIFLIKKRRKPN